MDYLGTSTCLTTRSIELMQSDNNSPPASPFCSREMPLNFSGLEAALTILSGEAIPELSDTATASRRVGISPTDYQLMSIRARNEHVIAAVRNARLARGHFAGWIALADLCSSVTLPSALVSDVITSIRVYDTIRPASPTIRPSTGLRMTITRAAENHDSLHHVPPKNLGGQGWRSSEEYLSAQRTWSNTGFEPLSPCVSFGWLGTQRKSISRGDIDDCDAMTLLGGVDFDMDRVASFASGFAGAFEIAERHTAEAGTRMQATALAALLNFDVQKYVRPIQEEWVQNGKGAANVGPPGIPPEDWVAALIGDNTSLCLYGYQGSDVYAQSQVGSFVALLLSNTHDVLYDRATSNLMSSVMYAAAAGVTKANVHCIFVTTFMDGIAKRFCLEDRNVETSVFGDNAMLACAPWAGFGERYRTWERFVKYSRQIARCDSREAREIGEQAAQHRVLADCTLLDVSEAWRRATSSTTGYNLVMRPTVTYTPAAASEIVGGSLPELCPMCAGSFRDALNAFASDEIRGVEGIPSGVVEGRAVARAAAIRRAVIFATSDSCCNICACRIGRWGDTTAHRVLTALICREAAASAVEWLLECYAVWTVMTFPVSVATVLAGFDLCCEMGQDEGAMGSRDVLDC
ncbi:hypothetical protein DFH09DRAFT_1283836 [Mycena vulgaris]|nr:hypothetical protein DFH09DRAFT_1283836 [Mycena vulgaris]